MRSGMQRCRKCGQVIGIIEWGIYRKALVDATAIRVIADPDGEEFIRIDGSKVLAREAAEDEQSTRAEYAYRLHRKTCEAKRHPEGWE